MPKENEMVATEGDDEEHQPVPADLLELYEVMEWNKAVEEAWKSASEENK